MPRGSSARSDLRIKSVFAWQRRLVRTCRGLQPAARYFLPVPGAALGLTLPQGSTTTFGVGALADLFIAA